MHTVQRGEVKLPGGLWIITERAVATEPGEPVDPVQAALWGFGRTMITEQPALRCQAGRLRRIEEAVRMLADLLATPVEEPELAVRQGKLLAVAAVAVGAQRPSPGAARTATTYWRRPNAARSTTFG